MIRQSCSTKLEEMNYLTKQSQKTMNNYESKEPVVIQKKPNLKET